MTRPRTPVTGPLTTGSAVSVRKNVSERRPTIDRRLIGTWKSDRRRTFKDFVFKPGASPTAIRKLKAWFGKMVVRWEYGTYFTELDGITHATEYQILAQDSVSVVIRYFNSLAQEERLWQIHFEGNHYWVHVGGNLREYFKRV